MVSCSGLFLYILIILIFFLLTFSKCNKNEKYKVTNDRNNNTHEIKEKNKLKRGVHLQPKADIIPTSYSPIVKFDPACTGYYMEKKSLDCQNNNADPSAYSTDCETCVCSPRHIVNNTTRKCEVNSKCDSVHSAGDCSDFVFPHFKSKLNDGSNSRLIGIIDMHNHMMSYLGFGGRLIHGAPDAGLPMPENQIYDPGDYPSCPADWYYNCNNCEVIAKDITDAMGTCRSQHVAWNGFTNTCGPGPIRKQVINQFQQLSPYSTNSSLEGCGSAHACSSHLERCNADSDGQCVIPDPHDQDNPAGFPTFADFPNHYDVIHQQMWIDWIRRAYDGGIRAIVMLAINDAVTSAMLGNTMHDRDTGDRQIKWCKELVKNHSSWMEIAYSSKDLRRIVGKNDSLAIILGSELDDIGNFTIDGSSGAKIPTIHEIKKEIQRLYDLGIRYIFPIHRIDNYFGGTAIFGASAPIQNKYYTGNWYDLRCADESDIVEKIGEGTLSGSGFLGTLGEELLGLSPYEKQDFPTCSEGVGHMNKKGLTYLGKIAIEKMISLGMMIDVDHMSYRTLQDVFAFTQPYAYPLNSGHSSTHRESPSEFAHTDEQYKHILSRNAPTSSPIGITTGVEAGEFTTLAMQVLNLGAKSLALGTDCMGMRILPPPPISDLDYNKAFNIPLCTTGVKTWNYTQDGVAHYGLYPEYFADISIRVGPANNEGKKVAEALFNGVEGFAQMWERCEQCRLKHKCLDCSSKNKQGFSPCCNNNGFYNSDKSPPCICSNGDHSDDCVEMKLDFSQLCKHGHVDPHTGFCASKCDKGWTGAYCDIKETSGSCNGLCSDSNPKCNCPQPDQPVGNASCNSDGTCTLALGNEQHKFIDFSLNEPPPQYYSNYYLTKYPISQNKYKVKLNSYIR